MAALLELHAQTPARNVHFMDALVAQIAVAGVPEPVPVVMETVLRELRSGAGPATDRNRRRRESLPTRLDADGIAPLVAQPARQYTSPISPSRYAEWLPGPLPTTALRAHAARCGCISAPRATSCWPSYMLCEHGFSVDVLARLAAQIPISECQWLGAAMEPRRSICLPAACARRRKSSASPFPNHSW